VGAKTANGGVNIELPRNATLFTGKTLVADLFVGNVVPGAAFEDVVFGKAHDAVLGMELRVHPLNDIANQRRLIVKLTERPQHPVAVTVAG